MDVINKIYQRVFVVNTTDAAGHIGQTVPESGPRPNPDTGYVLNPGSVGQPCDGDSRTSDLAITVAEDGSITVRAYRLAYDIAPALAKMRSRSIPELGAARLAIRR
ncbi:MAG: hypothetical protein KGS10_15860 [Chloroflexi bacterium]|jgi:hypothetical protein|nr:hypothetical protein [Chloroflexota bacterium]